MGAKVDFHIKVDKAVTDKAKELSGLTYKELFELGCKAAIEQYQTVLDREILELNDCMDRANELTESIRKKLKDKEVPTGPDNTTDTTGDDVRRNHIPFDLFKEMVLFYMDDYGITDLDDLGSKNKEVFKFVLINMAYHGMTMDEINELYREINSE